MRYPCCLCCATFCLLTASAAVRTSIGNDDMAVPTPEDGFVLRVWPEDEIGPIKPMNGSNSGPNALKEGDNPDPAAYHPSGRFDAFRDLSVPMIRTHDSRFTVGSPNRVNDIGLIFPDFDADENDPKNYDFLATDDYLNAARLAGSEIMYFLGTSSDKEMGGRPCGNDEPPKDFAKWARIAEHVVRHYNEGWGWTNANLPFSNQFNIVHWEIWNEPDLDCSDSYWETGEKTWLLRRRYWHGSPEQFFELYRTVATHLKKTFPNLKIGGPGLSGRRIWADRFLAYCEQHRLPLDFFTWHGYAEDPSWFEQQAQHFRSLLDKHGFEKTVTYLNEWNWQIGWSDDRWRESVRMRSEMNNYRIASFYAATMCRLQRAPVDGLMYYDMRTTCFYNGVFASNSDVPLKGYYPFFAWSKLRALGTEVKSALYGKEKDVHAVAARGADGSLAVLLTRFSSPATSIGTVPVRLSVPGRDLSRARLHMTDELDRYTEQRIRVLPDGTVTVRLRPFAFALVEIPCK